MKQNNDSSHERSIRRERLLQIAMFGMIVGLLCLVFYLSVGFGVWTFGLGILLGAPLVIVASALYVWLMLRDFFHQRNR